MADFNCYDSDQKGTLPIRRENQFPEGTRGVDEWAEIIQWLERLDGDTTPDEIDQQLNRIRNLPQQFSSLACPRVFVSHKSTDKAEALRISNLACNSGFDFWLDVLDPNLAAINLAPSSLQRSIATALIIEMALLNCTHVLAVMTPNTIKSRWVPYEYGRAKERVRISNQASAWLESSIRATVDFPEYLFLGTQHANEPDILHWFSAELAQWRNLRRLPTTNCGGQPWPHAPTMPLP